ncbi:MAG: hypothetical protein ACXU8N_07570 [Telluria sp.]
MPVDPASQPPRQLERPDRRSYDQGMRARIDKLEQFAEETRERLVRIESRLDSIEQTMATKADLQQMQAELQRALNANIMWTVGTAIGLGVAAITVMTFVLNNAVPKPAPATAAAPIVITIPPAPAAK